MTDLPPIAAPSVCVFCGSRDGDDPAFGQAARATGALLAENGWRLVYGAGDVGLMGQVASAATAKGGQTFGVIPVHLLGKEVGKRDLSTLVITENMHERKKVMFMNADVIVTLPGGAGSMDEFFEVMTWAQIGLHDKPIYLLNIKGYWEPLLVLIDHMIAKGFADASFRATVKVVADVQELEAALRKDLSR